MASSSKHSAVFVLLSSRFEVLESGHFYWYTIALQHELTKMKRNHLVISRTFPEQHQKDYEEWKIVDTEREWGKEAGEMAPTFLANQIEAKLREAKLSDAHLVFYSYESSYTLLAALSLLLENSPTRFASVNLLDTGYWEKFFGAKVAKWHPLAKALSTSFNRVGARFTIFSNNSEQVHMIRGIIQKEIELFPQISALDLSESVKVQKSSILPTNSVCNVLIFTWLEDLTFVSKFLNLVYSENADLGLRITIHLKDIKHAELLTSLNNECELRATSVVSGTLAQQDYINLIKSHDVCMVPYNDSMHLSHGSGRVIDALFLGRPVIVNSKSVSFEHAERVGAAFPYLFETPTSILDSIRQFKKSIFFVPETRQRAQTDLALISQQIYSVTNLINEIDKRSEYLAKNPGRTNSKRTFSILTGLKLDIVWMFLYTYQNFRRLYKSNFKKSY